VLVTDHADAVVDALAPALAAGIKEDLARDRGPDGKQLPMQAEDMLRYTHAGYRQDRNEGRTCGND